MTSTARKPLRVTLAQAPDAIRRRDPFVSANGTLTGGYETAPHPPLGRMAPGISPAFLLSVDSAVMSGAALYVVRSYGTPIAWAGPDELLTVPGVRYTVTTTRHQSICRRADYADGLCHGESPAGHGDPRCGRQGGHLDVCDWSD
jgi:hypothetical protein